MREAGQGGGRKNGGEQRVKQGSDRGGEEGSLGPGRGRVWQHCWTPNLNLPLEFNLKPMQTGASYCTGAGGSRSLCALA